MPLRKLTGTFSATVLLTAAVLAGTASAAHAVPESCTPSINGHTVSSNCTAGTGEHAIYVYFRHVNPMVGPMSIQGPWEPPGRTSTVSVPGTPLGWWVLRR
ncbi:hypothetical protein SAMN05421505_106121 [Sinosporangium album]|uniref:Secreted protein n=1 Tax=Sinosporangium album TaxID=504805 RepID=A0A1G7VZY0_9ACTN|nr:hypothetical protein [Sinosporangium album]SDG64969.1 hypothetical protein SAMN05421505_106121 [Sinosporangium album]